MASRGDLLLGQFKIASAGCEESFGRASQRTRSDWGKRLRLSSGGSTYGEYSSKQQHGGSLMIHLLSLKFFTWVRIRLGGPNQIDVKTSKK
jgi:hypothetical protein